jgi:hypothetical protein
MLRKPKTTAEFDSSKGPVSRSAHLRAKAFLFLALALSSVIAGTASAAERVEYDSNQLMIKTADEISEIVRKKIKKAQEIQAQQEDHDEGPFVAEPAAVNQLKDALRIVLARPDQDGTRSNAVGRLRRELQDLNAVDKVYEELTKEAISSLKNSSTPPRRINTYVVLLENLMAEIKPEIKGNEAYKKLIERIRDADIHFSEETRQKVFMRSMTKPTSPSETAGKILPKPADSKK